MEPRDFYSDPVDDLIAETLREQMGPPPDHSVWERIARDIAPPSSGTKQARNPLRRFLSQLQFALRTPIAQSVLALVLLAWVVVQPAHYWMTQEYPARPQAIQQSIPNERVKEQSLPASDVGPLPELALKQLQPDAPPLQIRPSGRGVQQ